MMKHILLLPLLALSILLNGLPEVSAQSPTPSASFLGQGETTSIPPDTHGAVGPNHVMTAVNGGVRIQDRSGNIIRSATLEAFLGRTNDDLFDPKVYYDHFANRFFMVVCANGGSANSATLIAGSQTADPNGLWNVYSYDADASNVVWADYPSVGFNKNWIAVGMNMFNISGNSFSTARIYVVPRAQLYAGGTLNTKIFTSDGFTPCPAITHDNNLSTLYVVEDWNASSGGKGFVRLQAITGEIGSEQFGEVGRPTTTQTWAYNTSTSGDYLPQAGSSKKINGGDTRMQCVVYRNGSIWATQNAFAGSGGSLRGFVQWWQISPSAVTQQFGRIEDVSGTFHYAFPSIAVNRNNDVLLGFSRFSSGTFGSAGYAFRASTDSAGTMRAAHIYKAGEANYFKTFGGSRNRWGDYSSTCVDPVDDTAFWTVQEYAATGNHWSTWWAKVDPPGTGSTIRFTQGSYSVAEGTANATVSITRSGNIRSVVTVNYATSNGSATAGSDYTATSGTATFGDGQDTVTFNVPITNDAIVETDETINLTLSSPGVGGTLAAPSSVILTIADNDVALPVITAAATDNSASEPSDTGVFTITRSGSTAVALTVAYTVGGSATAGSDYTTLSGSVTILAGSTTATVTVTPIDDLATESTETISLTLSANASYTLGTPNSGSINLLDNDQPTVVTLQVSDASAGENNNPGQFIVTRSGSTASALTVNYTIAGSATNTTDYAFLSGSVNIAAGATTEVINITPVNDTLVEGSENIILSLAAGSYTVGSPATATVTIADDDVATGNDAFAGRLALTTNNTSGNNTTATKEVGEPNHAGNVGGKSVWWTWIATFNGSVTFSSEGSSFDTTMGIYTGSAVNALSLIGQDDDTGSNRTSKVTFSAVNGTVYQIAIDGYDGVSGNIALSRTPDPAQLGTITIVATDTDATEGSADTGTFTISRTGATTSALTVNLAISGTSTNAIDYGTIATAFTLPVGAASGTISVTPIDDALIEGNETVIATIQSNSAYTVGAPSLAAVTVFDNDTTVGNDLFSNGAIMSVATTTGTNVSTTKESGEPNHAGNAGGTSVWWNWTPSFTGTVTLSTVGSNFNTLLAVYTGSAVNVLTLIANNDDIAPGSNTASSVTFSAVSGTTYRIVVDGFGGASGNITLGRTGDPIPLPIVTVVATDATAKEGSGDTGRFQIGRTGDTSASLTINLALSGTATDGADYTSIATTQVMGVGVTQLNINVIPVDDADIEGDETVIMAILPGAGYNPEGDAAGYAPGGRAVATVTIADNDSGINNDAFVNRTVLSGASFGVTGANSGYSKELNEPVHAGNVGGRSAWWTWTATANGAFSINTTGSAFDTLMSVYTGNTVSSLTQIASNDDAGPGVFTSTLTFTAVSGTVYQIVVDGYGGNNGAITLAGAYGAETLQPPVLTGPASAAGTVGLPFSYTITATNTPTSYNATGLPGGLSIDTGTGVISGIPTTTGEFNTTISATNATGPGNATLSISVSPSGGVVLYQTDFSAFSPGAGTIVGQDGWEGQPAPGPHGINSTFTGQGQSMYVGSLPFTETTAFFWRTVNYSPLASGTPLVRFSAEFKIVDSTNGKYDDFGFQVYNSDGEYLAGVIFDNNSLGVFVSDSTAAVAAGSVFVNDVHAHLDVEINFTTNTWTVSLGGVQLFAPRTFHAGGKSLTLGDVTTYWSAQDALNPGDNQLLIDNWSIVAYRTEPSSIANNTAISIPDGIASVYPSTITAAGFNGELSRLTVTLNGLTHTFPDDLDILLVAPNGQSVMLMSDAGGGLPGMTARTVVFDDLAPTSLLDATPPLHTARYKPTNITSGDVLPGPAPAGAPLTTLAGLYGTNPNGTWQLFVYDDGTGDVGSLTGWSLQIGTNTGSSLNYATWQASLFTSGEISGGMADPTDDTDNDGVLNVFEFAFNMNPRLSDKSSAQYPIATHAIVGGIPVLSYQYQRDISRTGITYALEVSTNLINWSPFSGQDVLVNQAGTLMTRKAYLPASNTVGALRLKVTLQ